MNDVARLLLVVGAVSTLLDVVARRYRSRLFDEHLAALDRGDPARDELKIAVVERAILWARLIAVLFLAAGVVLLANS